MVHHPHIEDFYRGDDGALIMPRTLMVLRALMKGGLIQAGAPTANGLGFALWEMPVDEAIARIEKEWDALGHAPSIGDIVWFAATPGGRPTYKAIGFSGKELTRPGIPLRAVPQ